MEFYTIGFFEALASTLFQFPTGWNSTSIRTFELFQKYAVSIPNGMEFYSRWFYEYWFRHFGFQFPTGWNSTPLRSIEHLFLIVSIPNGMEFYYVKTSSGNGQIGFNSQRDGILQEAMKSRSWAFNAFQFPTGWNSTRGLPHCRR